MPEYDMTYIDEGAELDIFQWNWLTDRYRRRLRVVSSMVVRKNMIGLKHKIENTDRAWLRAAMVFGLTMSKDPECQLGACIVSADGHQVSFGYNGFPAKVSDVAERWDGPLKNELVIHAEENAIINAKFDTSESTLYICRKPCHKCVGRAINAGVEVIVYYNYPVPWKHEIPDLVEVMTGEAGVGLIQYEYTIEEWDTLHLYNAQPKKNA